jgi:molybdate transport system substrate-binding protein
LIRDGLVAERFDLAQSGIGVAVKAGAPKPDIGSGEAVKRAVLAAKGIAYSTGPSGIYLAGLFQRWGIDELIRDKVTRTQGEPSGGVAARGGADLAFQQVSELLPVPGIDIVGPLPPDIQQITIFSAGLHASAQAPDAARALVQFLKAPAAAPVIRRAGMEPV